MTDTPPDHCAANPKSRFYDEAALMRGIGVRFKGIERTNVDEYCVSEGWVRVTVGASKDRFGMPLTMKLTGPVEVYFRDVAETGATEIAEAGATEAGATGPSAETSPGSGTSP